MAGFAVSINGWIWVSTEDEFSGEVNWVQIDLEDDDHDHLISPEERFKIAMVRQ